MARSTLPCRRNRNRLTLSPPADALLSGPFDTRLIDSKSNADLGLSTRQKPTNNHRQRSAVVKSFGKYDAASSKRRKSKLDERFMISRSNVNIDIWLRGVGVDHAHYYQQSDRFVKCALFVCASVLRDLFPLDLCEYRLRCSENNNYFT